ncbi:MAG: nuclear transport factor 2 family protein [Gammaproteobacteria bacterium]|nr:nuclear transport factor 2 family protein [Gammaproteobacteria bacterium]MDH4313894.1 nuclear transport factor 2 family protein [Gammaproteobacteria bacterium]MDH5213831.1 nuclear transport factor 2 family protein [Gammaproteobacteria bacterium]MDH5501925.1 nuclear transport factor 2 family protein [Gammaproteobacteria bacterium]
MTGKRRLIALTTISLILGWGISTAQQQAASDQAAVWSVIEDQWERNERGDNKWIDELLVADFVGWPNESPAPRTKSSVRMWDEFSSKQTETLEHELYPLSIVVHGDMAIAHYLYTSATRQKGAELKISNGRYTDVLVRDDGVWKFISWHGGDDD